MNIFERLFRGRPSPVDQTDIWQGVDSELLTRIESVDRAIKALSADVPPATKREVADRAVRSIGQQVYRGNIRPSDFSEVERGARYLLRTHYNDGLMDATVLQAALGEFRDIPIERKSRNFTAQIWERHIAARTDEVETRYRDITHGTVVVSVDWGGLEPAYLLAEALGVGVVHVKPFEDSCLSFQCGDSGEMHRAIIVEDVVRSGDSLRLVEQYVRTEFAIPYESLVIHTPTL